MLVVNRYAAPTCIRKHHRMVPGSSPSGAVYMDASCSMHTCTMVGNAHSFIGYQVPHSQIPIHPTPLSACLCCTSIPIPTPTSSHIQCRSDQHYYAHSTLVKSLESGLSLRLDQKELGTRNRTRRTILPIPTNVRLFSPTWDVAD